jgi:hypothetical protein
MAHLASVTGTPVYDETEVYDKAHGCSTYVDTAKPTNLSEAGNKAPAQYNPLTALKSY